MQAIRAEKDNSELQSSLLEHTPKFDCFTVISHAFCKHVEA